MKNNLSQPELAWQAFQYIAGELPPAELASFEVLLAHDQAAREAVVSAVELSASIWRAETVESPVQVGLAHSSQAFSWASPLVRFVLAVSAVVLLAWQLSRMTPTQHDFPTQKVALAWSDSLASPATLLENDSLIPEFEAEEAALLDSTHPLLAEPVPSWMVEAVRGLQHEPVEAATSSEELES